MAIRQSSRTRPFPFIANTDGHEVDQEAVFGYLELVRLTGKINMLGVPPHIIKKFKVSKVDAMKLFTAWCEHKQQEN